MTSTLNVTSGNLHSVLIGGGASTQLTGPAANGYGVYGANFEITSDNQRVVYPYQANAAAQTVLQSVSITGGSATTLYTPGSDEPLYRRQASPDGQWVVFNTSPSYTVRAIPVSGGSSVNLGHSADFMITPDSGRVVFATDFVSGNYDLISTQIFGGGVRNLSRFDPDSQVGGAAISPDGQWIAYQTWHTGSVSRPEIRLSDGGEAQQELYLPMLQR